MRPPLRIADQQNLESAGRYGQLRQSVRPRVGTGSGPAPDKSLLYCASVHHVANAAISVPFLLGADIAAGMTPLRPGEPALVTWTVDDTRLVC